MIKRLTYIKLAIKEVFFRKKYYLLFALTIGFGLAGLMIVLSIQRGIINFLGDSLRDQLTGDLVVSSQQLITDVDKNKLAKFIPKGSQSTQITKFVTVIRDQKSQITKTVQLFAIENNYPLQGKVLLQEQGPISSGLVKALAANKIWIAKDLALSLDSKIGDTIQLGDQKFTLDDIVVQAPLGGGFSALAPKVYINQSNLAATNLVSGRSRVDFDMLYTIPDHEKADDIRLQINKAFANPDGSRGTISSSSYKQANNNISKLSDTTVEYLNAITMLAFVLAAMGSIYLFYNFFSKKQQDFAILKMLGLKRPLLVLLWQMFIQSILAVIVTITIASLIIFLINWGLNSYLQLGFKLYMNIVDIMKIGLIAFIGLPIFCIPALYAMLKSNTNDLFSDVKTSSRVVFSFKENIYTKLPVVLLILLTTFLIAPRIKSFLVILLLAAVFICLYLLAKITLYLLPRFTKKLAAKNIWCRQALLILTRYPASFIQLFIAISASSIMLFLIPSLYYNVKDQLESPKSAEMPQFFLFDIQPDQKEAIAKYFKVLGVHYYNEAPMVRVEMVKINGEPAAKWLNRFDDRDDNQQNDQTYRTNFNISYKDGWNESETIVAGPKEWPKADNIPKVSLEKNFANRLNLNIGDRVVLTIDNQEITTEVYNIRTVKWNYFYPNFFIVAQNGYFDSATRIYLANLNGIDNNELAKISYGFSKNFPNVPFIDVRQLISTLLNLSFGIMLFVLLIGILAFITGILALYGIMLSEANNQNKRNNLFMVLGSRAINIKQMVLMQYSGVVIPSTIFSGIITVIGLILINKILFDIWPLISYPILISALLFVAIVVILAMTFTSNRQAVKPQTTLFG